MLVTDGWRVNVLDYYGLYEMVTQSQRTLVPHLVKREQRLQENVIRGRAVLYASVASFFSDYKTKRLLHLSIIFAFLNQIYTVVNIFSVHNVHIFCCYLCDAQTVFMG